MWIPTKEDILDGYSALQRSYKGLRHESLMKAAAIDGIADKVKYGLLYSTPTIEQRAAILLYDLIHEHCYSDGNKRIAFLSAVRFLAKNDRFLTGVELSSLIEFTMNVASGKLSFREVEDYIGCNIKLGDYSTVSEFDSLIDFYDTVLRALGE